MKKKIKIGILIDQLVPGGVQKSAIREAIELKKLGYEVTLFVLVRLSYSYQYNDLTEGIKVVYLSDFNPWPFKKAYRIPYFAFLTHLHLLNPLFVKRYKCLKSLDFIISHGTTTCITAAAITKVLKIPYMAFIYDPMIFILEKVYSTKPVKILFPFIKPLTFFFEKSFLDSAALVVTQSKVHQEYIKNIYQVDPLIINPACNPPKKLAPFKKNGYLLGYTRWELAKNPRLFIWLAKKLPRAKFLVAGYWNNPTEEAIFRSEIKKNNLENQITVNSQINEDQIDDIAGNALAWIHPNFEAFGVSGLEMASFGLPIIVPFGSGITYLFKEGEHGFFPNSNNKEAYLDQIKFLINNPEKASLMGKKAAEIAKHCTWKNHAKTTINYIENYLNQTKVVWLANAFVATYSTGGGDQFTIELGKRVPSSFHLTVILPRIGYYHWSKANITRPNLRFIVLNSTWFDNSEKPINLFLAYLIRTIQTFFLLPKLSPFSLLYTSTDIICDSLPAYLFKRAHPNIPWVARFFHFIEYPLKREGRFWVNTGAYILQQLCLIFLKNSDSILIDNSALKEILTKKGIKEKIIQLHPGGTNLNFDTKPKKIKKLESSAIFVGRLQPHKGVFDAIEAWRNVALQKPDSKLILIGYSSKEVSEKLNELINKYNLKRNILILDYLVDKNSLLDYLASSKMLIFLDHEAGYGLVVVEAMSLGLPVVAYDLEIFGSTYTKGYITSPLKDTKSISNTVLDLLNNQNKWRKLSKEAKGQAKKYDWGEESKRFYDRLKFISN